MNFKSKIPEDQILLLEAFKMATRETSKKCAEFLKCGEITFSNWLTGKTRLGNIERTLILSIMGLQETEQEHLTTPEIYPLPEDIEKNLLAVRNKMQNRR